MICPGSVDLNPFKTHQPGEQISIWTHAKSAKAQSDAEGRKRESCIVRGDRRVR